MLKQRIITAIIIAAAFLALVFIAPWKVFFWGVLFIFAVAAWEWANLSGLKNIAARLVYSLGFTLLAAYFGVQVLLPGGELLLRQILIMAAVFWCVALLAILTYPRSEPLWAASFIRTLLGVVVLLPACLALFYLKQQQPSGILIVIAVVIIALADIGAYFAGRAWGKRKLAPQVSPGKTWEGVLGGLACNLALACLLAFWLGLSLQQAVLLGLALVIISFVSVEGDLLESMLKRHRGIKDSGSILPGHGGVLDRIDGWTAALPLFALAYHLVFASWF